MTTKTQFEELNDDDLNEIQGGAINGETLINVPVKPKQDGFMLGDEGDHF